MNARTEFQVIVGIGVSNVLVCDSLPGLHSSCYQQWASQKLVALVFGLQLCKPT